MPPLDQNEKNAACSGIDLAARALSQQAFSAGTLSAENTRGRDCPAVPKFNSVDELLADVQSRQKSGSEQLSGFQINGSNDRDMRDAFYAMEDITSKKIDYTFFADDKGNIQAFILGRHDKGQSTDTISGPAKPTDAVANKPAGCVEFGSLPDANLNRQLGLAPGTPQFEATGIHLERSRQADLLVDGIDPSLTAEQANQVRAERAAALKDLPPVNVGEPGYDQYVADHFAIKIGLPRGTSLDEVQRVQDDFSRQARAVKIGLSRDASNEDILAATQQINLQVDAGFNLANGYPVDATAADALQLGLKRIKDSDLVTDGIDPNVSPDDVHKIRAAREQRAVELESGLAQPGLTDEETQALELRIKAARAGLPEDSTKDALEAATAQRQHQALAVAYGLPANASDAEIAAAKKRSEDYELAGVPDNLCPVTEPEKKNDQQ